MSDEIKVKKEDVLKAYQYYKNAQTIKQPQDMVLLLIKLFPEVFQEEKKESINGNEMSRRFNDAFTHTEKKESELEDLLHAILLCPKPTSTFEQHRKHKLEYKQQIIDLAKKKVDECQKHDLFTTPIYYVRENDIKQKLEEM